MKIRQDGDCIVSGDKKGEIKVMKFSLFKGDLSKAPSCITIKAWFYIYHISIQFINNS